MMSKKSKKKKYNYNEVTFIKKICDKCRICGPSVRPEFCFGAMYLEDPKTFIASSKVKLIEISGWGSGKYLTGENIPDENYESALKTAFCRFCDYKTSDGGWDCKMLAGCLLPFRNQILGSEKTEDLACAYGGHQAHRGALKRKKEKIKRNPVPAFFCNDSFSDRIEKILNENNPKEQDIPKGLP